MSKNSIVFWFVFVKNKNNESSFKDIVKDIRRWRKIRDEFKKQDGKLFSDSLLI